MSLTGTTRQPLVLTLKWRNSASSLFLSHSKCKCLWVSKCKCLTTHTFSNMAFSLKSYEREKAMSEQVCVHACVSACMCSSLSLLCPILEVRERAMCVGWGLTLLHVPYSWLFLVLCFKATEFSLFWNPSHSVLPCLQNCIKNSPLQTVPQQYHIWACDKRSWSKVGHTASKSNS